MSNWTKNQRMEAVLNGELADRPPITCYHHFTSLEHGGARLMADTFLDFQKQIKLLISLRSLVYER